MTPEELAEKAFNRLTDEERKFYEEQDLEFTEPPPFENLTKQVKDHYLEVARSGGDASRFGKIVEDILKETAEVSEETETDEAVDGNANSGANLDDTREELMRHTRTELVEKAVGLGLTVADNATKTQIVDAILEAEAKPE